MVHGDGFSRSPLLRRVSRVIAPSPSHNTADQSAPSTLTAVYRPTDRHAVSAAEAAATSRKRILAENARAAAPFPHSSDTDRRRPANTYYYYYYYYYYYVIDISPLSSCMDTSGCHRGFPDFVSPLYLYNILIYYISISYYVVNGRW